MKKVLMALSAIVLVTGCIFASIYYIDNRKANFSDDHVLYVYPDMTSQDILCALDSVVLNDRSLARCFSKEDVAQKVKPGRYVINRSTTSIYVARMLNFGWQTPQNMTLSGTIRNKEVLAKRISMQMMADSASIAAALDSAEFLSEYGFISLFLYLPISSPFFMMIHYTTFLLKNLLNRQIKAIKKTPSN